jgi:hypothetical protein
MLAVDPFLQGQFQANGQTFISKGCRPKIIQKSTQQIAPAHWPNFILSTSVIYTKLRPLGKRSPLRCDQRRNLFALEILERNGANLCRL